MAYTSEQSASRGFQRVRVPGSDCVPWALNGSTSFLNLLPHMWKKAELAALWTATFHKHWGVGSTPGGWGWASPSLDNSGYLLAHSGLAVVTARLSGGTLCRMIAKKGFEFSPLSLLSYRKNSSCRVALSSTGLNSHSKRLSCHLAKDEVKTKLICETLIDL